MRVGRLVSVIGGYALNYFHWVTEILPGLIRLRPLITADSSVRVLTHASVEWSRGILVVRGAPYACHAVVLIQIQTMCDVYCLLSDLWHYSLACWPQDVLGIAEEQLLFDDGMQLPQCYILFISFNSPALPRQAQAAIKSHLLHNRLLCL